MDKLKEAVEAHWGERCDEAVEGCPICDAWAEYDGVTEMREALEWYADQMCEGYCQGKDPKACAVIGADNCSGCQAVTALGQLGSA